MDADRPWLRYYGKVPASLDYPPVTLYEALMQTVSRRPDAVAFDFFGKTTTYREFSRQVTSE